MSMTPSGRRSRRVVTIAIDRTEAPMLISSANPTNRYSSPPQLYRVLLGSSIGFGCSSRLFEPRLERGGMELSCREPRLAQQLSEQLRRRADALDDHLAESSPSALDCRLPVISPQDIGRAHV